ncbi:LPS export ABC transporter periplasmic protein LptC [Aerosakkonema funiforme]|uniref:LPS export ABC transporter periplasmic protein LptC n=1 Tax=Aerosakkonema funiforme FACHB-1375 TaxID=2949571 RepID=A0A926VFR3_9CYAN|nr:LPS export ABC transporter periplasmic protein LptC [Aerosakkonema funiforme]MBD2182835.1 LPS export ABC transporter periplasmic protein LptC [Aerosakkonema funiforme FACHB-1375]
MNKNNRGKIVPLKLVFLLPLLLSIVACRSDGRTAKKLAQDSQLAQESAAGKNVEGGFTFNEVTLDRADEKGSPVWKIKAKQAVYSNNNKIAQIQSPIGDLFQDGKLLYQVTGQQGEVHQDGKKIFLKGQIVATDIQNGVVLRGNEMEWRPQEDLLIVRNQLTGTHKQVDASAREARAFSREKRIELIGNVVAFAKEQSLQMRTEHLTWEMQNEKMYSNRPVQFYRYIGTTIADRGFGDRGDVDLKNKIATLKKNGQLALLDPPLDIASNFLIWNVTGKTVTSEEPVRISHRVQQVTLTGDRGRVDLEPKIAYLSGKVFGVGKRPPSQMRTDKLTWYLPTETFEAVGNVYYRQTDPPLSLTGPKAVGQLKNQTIVLSGGNSGGRVVTEIVP